MTRINVYCDESCHLEHDGIPVMTLGALSCPSYLRTELSAAIRRIKHSHGISPNLEIKWTKVSPGQQAFYEDLIDLFFASEMNFRAVVVTDKSKLDHEAFGQDHDTFYYKLYYLLLTRIFEEGNNYRIYLDIKDTRGQKKVEKLHEILCNAHMDFDRRLIERVQQVRSHEVDLLQLSDLLLGAITFGLRDAGSSKAKVALVERLRDSAKISLTRSTLPSAKKLNLFLWSPRDIDRAPA